MLSTPQGREVLSSSESYMVQSMAILSQTRDIHANQEEIKQPERPNRMILDPWQKEFLKVEGDKILCTGRQVGKSVICSMDAANYAAKNPKTQPIVMIAPTERQAYALFSKTLEYLLFKYPRLVVTKGTKKPTKKRICLRTGVEIYCLPVGVSGLGIRFLTIGRLYIDECSRMPEDVFTAIEPALLTTGGDTILLSTPAGTQGEFYKTWVNKDNAYESFARFSIDSEKVMTNRKICESWTEKQRDRALQRMDRAKKRWSNNRYMQEYMGEFVEDLHRWFSDELIQKCCSAQRKPFVKDKEYYLGCDIARMGEDAGTFEILDKIDKDNIVHVENIVTRKKLTTETEDKIVELDRKYNFKKILIDAGAGTLGVSILDHLLIIDQVKRKVIAVNNAKRILGHGETGSTKLLKIDLYDNLRALMEQDKIKLLDDDEVIESLRSIQYENVTKQGEPTKTKIWGDDSHIVEGLIRAALCVKYKNLNISIHWI